MSVVALSDDELQSLLRWWCNELPLADWTIKVLIRGVAELGLDHARVAVNELKCTALIRLLNPAEANPEEAEPYDQEVALVHELLHIALAPFMDCARGSHKDIRQEQTIHALSKSLVAMRRANQPRRRASQKLVVLPRQKAAA